MAQHQQKISQTKTQTSAANTSNNAVQLKDNRESHTVQKMLHIKAIGQESTSNPIQKKENSTGLPDNLKSGIENLSGHSMDDVKVHYNSSQPAQLNAHAYAQGTDIHIASGQEKHLPHEAWHVVQQKQGRVKPTLQMKGKVNINDDTRLENEADVMGAKALQTKPKEEKNKAVDNYIVQKKNNINQGFGFMNNQQEVVTQRKLQEKVNNNQQPIQRLVEINGKTYSNENDFAVLKNKITVVDGVLLTDPELSLLNTWVNSAGPRSIIGFKLSSGLHKKYNDYEELVMALKGDVGSRENLEKETEFALKIPNNEKIKARMNSLAKKIFAYIEREKDNFDKKKGKEDFWDEASKSYRSLWNFVGIPYNLNYYASLAGAFGSGGRGITQTPSYKPPKEAFKESLEKPEGNITDIFASMKQVSNVYSEKKGKNNFTTPKLANINGILMPVEGKNKESGEKRYNTQSLKEKEDWTKYARSRNIPVSAGASGSMDRMYRLAQDAGANSGELFALALAGHYVFNQVYTMLSNDPHTFHEIMDPIHKYVNTEMKLGYNQRLKQMEKWMK